MIVGLAHLLTQVGVVDVPAQAVQALRVTAVPVLHLATNLGDSYEQV